jgi:hypothetical protein
LFRRRFIRRLLGAQKDTAISLTVRTHYERSHPITLFRWPSHPDAILERATAGLQHLAAGRLVRRSAACPKPRNRGSVENLHGIHEPSMKIRAPIRTLKQHSSMLGSDASKNMVAALKQLDSAVTDLHSAADAGDQKEAESALKAVQTALDELKALDPETAFK